MSAVLVCLSICSCQDTDTPEATTPEVTTLAVSNVTGRKANFSGTVTTEASCYFLVAQTANFTDADTIAASIYQNEGLSSYNCIAEYSGLKPGKTYYVCLCATDGRSYVNGNSITFTTPTYLEIANVYLTDIDGYSTNSYTPENPLGVFVLSSWSSSYVVLGSYSNMQAAYSDSEITLPYDISLDTDVKVYAYYPYTSEYDGSSIPIRANESYYGVTTPTYLYGSSNTVNGDDTGANITMKYALSKVTLSITNSSSDAAELTKVVLSNSDGEYLASSGKMNVFTGVISDLGDYEDHTLTMSETIASGSTYTANFMIIPISFDDNQIVAKVTIGGKQMAIALPAATWSKSAHYTYQISVDKDALTLSGIRIEQWDSQNGGDININQD